MSHPSVKTGKALYDFTLSELIEEYKKANGNASNMVLSAMELNVLDLKRDEIDAKLKEFEDYASQIANEFIRRFA